jgi:enolase
MPAVITSVHARTILDSRGRETIEVRLAAGSITATASCPTGESAGTHEARSLPPTRFLRAVTAIVNPRTQGIALGNQKKFDYFLGELDGTDDKSNLGGNTILALSIAYCRASAQWRRVPIWKQIAILARAQPALPRLFVNLIEGGVHAGGTLPFQEYIAILAGRSAGQSVMNASRLYHALGDELRRVHGDHAIGVGDEGGYAAACPHTLEPFAHIRSAAKKSGLPSYSLGLDAAVSHASIADASARAAYRKLAAIPEFLYLEDPYSEEAFDMFAGLKRELPRRLWVAGDDLTVTNVERMRRAHQDRSINAVVIKPNQIGSVSEAIDAVMLARSYRWRVIASHRGRETNDDFIADFAVGAGADGLKIGAPCRGERVAKYNRILEIGQEIKKAR